MIRCIPITSCAECPYRKRHYGADECGKLNWQKLPKISADNGIATAPPDWCPLPPHPSFAAGVEGTKNG